MNPQPVTVNRVMVGAIGLVLMSAAGILVLIRPEGVHDMWAGACLKIGLLMITLWLALPSITSNPDLVRVSWATLFVVIVEALIVARTRVPLKVVVPVLIAFVIAIRILRPRRSTSTRPRTRN